MFIQFPSFFAISVLASLATQVLSLNIPPGSEFAGKRSIEERHGVVHTIFEHDATGATIDYVKNSGICETTPGVNQYSGYFSVGKNMSMWFWFFEARHDSDSAPLALWLNGGPGCSSMIALFQARLNHPSIDFESLHFWNEYANMIYVDEPIGTGFSYGNDTVFGTVSAAPFVWKLLQAFFAHFKEYEKFAYYFEQQNAAIHNKSLHAEEINLVALGINNGWYDAIIQEREYISFSANNTYYPLINTSIADAYMANYTAICLPALLTCNSTTEETPQCFSAHEQCNDVDNSFSAYYPDIDPYDIRQPASAPFPPETYVNYLNSPAVLKAIGAKVTYSECSDAADLPFAQFGDGSRSFLPTLSSVVQSGITVLLWAGDADSVCDWFGGFASVNAVEYSGSAEFRSKAVANYTVGGVVKGTYKSVGNLSWLRVFASGHEVPAWEPELSLQVFRQTLQKRPISST
ncbi:Carboxypeptidase [Lachnellula occidentalis]|uniref:Carboxypeptidase n=1 Tax=Lachnellula occidentalis TaxID=215460 RepID=A0A8H8RTP0_9HELO|nr:Carboxypeptidase [Lachnellula occidentalis]